MVYLGQYTRWFTLARTKDDLTLASTYTKCLTLASIQDVLPWPVFKIGYLVSIQDGFPWLVYTRWLILGSTYNSTRWPTFSRLEDDFTLAIVYRIGYLGQYTRRLILASTQDDISRLVYKMDYLG
jgi:hypothetical protein